MLDEKSYEQSIEEISSKPNPYVDVESWVLVAEGRYFFEEDILILMKEISSIFILGHGVSIDNDEEQPSNWNDKGYDAEGQVSTLSCSISPYTIELNEGCPHRS